MSTLTTSVRGVSTIVAHSKFTPRQTTSTGGEMPQPDRNQKISERITPEILNTLGTPVAHASSTRHQWQAGKHTIIQQIDVETKTEPLPLCSHEARGCCHEGLEGRLSSSSSKQQCAREQCGRDIPDNMRSCGDGEHSECSDSHTSQSEECRHHENSPCDCCRHGHSLTSFIRSPEDCRTCFRHMGGAFVSPKYPQIRQRMLKTLNQRRDHSEDNPEAAPKVKVNPPPVSVNSIPCGKKERLLILNTEHSKKDVDDLVRMIEGTSSCNDPRKAAKKARQKEKKIQSKAEEDFRREEQERKMKEAEERIRREQEQREEEERRKAEELKRQARRVKKKNRKKKDADKTTDISTQSSVLLKTDGGERQNDGSSLLFSAVTTSSSPSETVRKVLETANPLNDDGANSDKPRMVTIRRHPATHDNQNVVTITLNDEKGKSPVYMLLNGHLVSSDAFSEQIQEGNPTLKNQVEETAAGDKRKKKNKKKQQQQPQPKSSQCNNSNELESCYSHSARDNGSAPPPLSDKISATPMSSSSSSSHYNDNHLSSVDLDNLSLPPGITITKVPNTGKGGEGFADSSISPEKVSQQYRVPEEHQMYYVDDDDDFLGRKETQEFEEVINKTRRKKMKAARTSNDRDGSEETETRESPSSVKHLTRRPFICDSKSMDIPSNKVVNNTGKGGMMTKTTSSFKKANGNYATTSTTTTTTDYQNGGTTTNKPRREHTNFRHDGFSSVNHAQVPVMPRLHRAHLKNREVTGISHCHVTNTTANPTNNNNNYDGRQQLSYSSFDSHQNNQSLNGGGVTMSATERNYTDVPLTSPQQQQQQQQLLQQQQQFLGGGSRGNGATSAPPHTSWTQSQGGGGGSGVAAGPTQFSHPSSLSVVQVAEHEQQQQQQEGSWNPWKDWSEHSTPEHPSPRFGVGDQFYRDAPPPKTFAFHELNQKSKSPIQRPIHNPLESGNSSHLMNGGGGGHERYNFARELPTATRPTFASFQSNYDNGIVEREAMYRYQQQQQQQRQAAPSPFAQNFVPFNGQQQQQRAPMVHQHPTEQEQASWNAFSGVQPPAYLQQRRSSDKGDFILTQQQPSPIQGRSGDISWEPYSGGKKSPLQETAERLHQLTLSPLTELSDLARASPGFRIGGGYEEHQHPSLASGFVGDPRSHWEIGPTTASRNFSAKTPFPQPPPESYNWDPSFHSRYTGGGAV